MTRSSRNPNQTNYLLAHKASVTDDGLKIVWYGMIEHEYVRTVERAAFLVGKQAAVLFPGDSESRAEFERLVNLCPSNSSAS